MDLKSPRFFFRPLLWFFLSPLFPPERRPNLLTLEEVLQVLGVFNIEGLVANAIAKKKKPKLIFV